MTQFLIQPNKMMENRVRLDADEAHHVRDVFRMKEGDEIRLFDGDGHAFIGKIDRLTTEAVEVLVTSALSNGLAPAVQVHLAQAMIPNDAMDEVITRATELNAASIIPLVSERTIVKLNAKKRQTKKEHWEKVSIAACKQCNRPKFPVIEPVTEFDKLLRQFDKYDLVLVADPRFSEMTIKECLAQVFNIRKTLVVIGPEGGFGEDEILELIKTGARIVSLGNSVLRSETAAQYILSVFKYLYEDHRF